MLYTNSTISARWVARLVPAALLLAGLPLVAQVAAPGTAPMQPRQATQMTAYNGPKYDNRFELFGGLSFMNGQAGQNLQNRYNMGGGEAQLTWFPGSSPVGRWGVMADYRFEAGTTPTAPNPGNNQQIHLNRVLVMQHIMTAGVVYRGYKNRYVSVDYHAQAGEAYGIFDYAVTHYPGGSPVSACPAQQQAGQIGNLGLYCNGSTPWGAVGGSIDFNQSNRFSVRLSPDMIFEHYGTETREYFSIGGGILWRFGKR